MTELRARGLDVWYDRTNLQDGHMLSTEIERELERRTAFVVLLTPTSVDSYWVKLEVAAFHSLAARDATRLMLPVRIAECQVPLLMAGIKWVDAVSLGLDAAVEAMATALGAPSESADDLIAQGKALMARGKHSDALSLIKRATQLDLSRVDSWLSLGGVNIHLGRHKEALAAYERAGTRP